MTLIEALNEASSILNNLVDAVNRYTKRGRDVPADLLAQFGRAYEAKEAALEALERSCAGRK